MRGDLHIIVDLQPAARKRRVLFGQHRQRIQDGKDQRNRCHQGIAALRRQPVDEQKSDQDPAADTDPFLARLERLRRKDRGRDGFPGERLSHSDESFLTVK